MRQSPNKIIMQAAPILLLVLVFGASSAEAQAPKDKEIRSVPSEIRARIELYFDLKQKENWEKLYEIDDWPIRNKEDYINIHIADKTNPYIKVKRVLDIGLSDSMFYWASSNKWEIEGCAKFVDKEGKVTTASGSVYVFNNSERGWVITDVIPSWFGNGWRDCKVPIDKLPIKPILSK